MRNPRDDKIEKRVKLNFDGKQFFVRIPNRIANEFELDQDREYEIKISVDKPECHRKKKKLAHLEIFEVKEDV